MILFSVVLNSAISRILQLSTYIFHENYSFLTLEIVAISKSFSNKISIFYLGNFCCPNYRTRAIIKFIYSEKAAKFCEIFTLLLSYVSSCQSKVR